MRIGPAGNSQSFYDAGFKKTAQAGAWLKALGLNAFEYPFGRGVRIKEESAAEIGRTMSENGVAVSVHAPYFINLAVDDPERREKNFAYFREAAQAAKWLGADRMVFHPGSTSKIERGVALKLAEGLLKEVLHMLDEEGHDQLVLCPETMGKVNQLGDLQEVIALCQLDERLLPTIDFAHLHAREQGAMDGREAFAQVLDALEKGLGKERSSQIHVHFSRIEFTRMGEKRHHTFADIEYGPDFWPLAELIAERNYHPRIICESNGTMAEDALAMKKDLIKAGAEVE